MIKLENVSKIYYRGRRPLKALDDVNIELPSKGMTFIVGENGSGKSTLAGIIAGIDELSSGNIYFNSVNYNGLNMSSFRSNIISFVFQEVNLLEDFNVYDNLKIALKLSGIEIEEDKINEVLKKLNIENVGKRFKHELSIGQMQRVAIARAILKNSKVLICDEATSALDEENSIQVFNILKELSKDRLVIVITHDMNIVSQYSENVIQLDSGKVIKSVKIENDNIIHNYKKPKSIIKYGYKLFLKRKKTLIISLILASISLFILSVAFNLAIFTPNSYLYTYIKRLDLKYVRVEEYRYIDEKYLIHSYVNEDFFNRNTSVPVIQSTSLYYDNFNGFVYLNDEVFERLNYKILCGQLPNNEMDNYVAISDYLFYVYLDVGFCDVNGEVVPINSKEDLINKKIRFNDIEYNISGIVDTGFDWERYKFLKDYHGPTMARTEMMSLRESSMIFCFYVNEKNINGEIYKTFLITDNEKVLKDIVKKNSENIFSIIDFYLGDSIKINTFIKPYIPFIIIIVSIFVSLILFLLVNENMSVRSNDIALFKSIGTNNVTIFKMFYL